MATGLFWLRLASYCEASGLDWIYPFTRLLVVDVTHDGNVILIIPNSAFLLSERERE